MRQPSPPEYRGRGAGSAFFDHAVRQLGEDAVRYRLWVHGSATDTGIESPAHAFATLHGFEPVRVLYKMVLPLDAQTREELVDALTRALCRRTCGCAPSPARTSSPGCA